MPVATTRAQRFDDLVLDAVERLQHHLPDLAGVDVAVEDVPPARVLAGVGPGEAPIPLGRAEPASAHHPARVVVHRRCVELRARDPLAVADLVRDVVAEQVAALFGLTPEQVDPDYEGPDEPPP